MRIHEHSKPIQGWREILRTTEVSPAVQVKLLRVLQEKKVRRVGENRTKPADARVIAATNRDLEARVAAGQFREDLLYRVRVLEIRVPPLRERREDIVPLARHFGQRLRERLNLPRRDRGIDLHRLPRNQARDNQDRDKGVGGNVQERGVPGGKAEMESNRIRRPAQEHKPGQVRVVVTDF